MPGVNVKTDAHSGYVIDPSAQDDKYCAPCHADIVEQHGSGLHGDQTGFKTMLLQRSGETELTSDMEQMLDEQCSSCHTTCGQCHVSLPDISDGGLLEGHKFRRPCATRNCSACHETRVGDEFAGNLPRLDADLHYSAGIKCFDCHTGDEMHGVGGTADNRYESPDLPKCIDCHEDVLDDDNEMHQQHGEDIGCHVCHSLPYTNCYNCHVTLPGNVPDDEVELHSEVDFRVGRNPIKSESHPWEYVLLRHVPVYPGSFEEYDIELDNFNSLPTWKYTSPHNIQRKTPQNDSCGKCHGNPNLFLTEFYVNTKIAQGLMTEEELEANQDVILEEIPN